MHALHGTAAGSTDRPILHKFADACQAAESETQRDSHSVSLRPAVTAAPAAALLSSTYHIAAGPCLHAGSNQFLINNHSCPHHPSPTTRLFRPLLNKNTHDTDIADAPGQLLPALLHADPGTEPRLNGRPNSTISLP